MDVRDWNHCQRHIHALKYEPWNGGVCFQESIQRLVNVIQSLQPQKIVMKWHKNESELSSKFFAFVVQPFRDHQPIKAYPRVSLAKPAILREEVKAVDLSPITQAVQPSFPLHRCQHMCNSKSCQSDEKIEPCALVEFLYNSLCGIHGTPVGRSYRDNYTDIVRHMTRERKQSGSLRKASLSEQKRVVWNPA